MQCVVIRLSAVAVAVGMVAGLAGCGATPKVSRSDVESKSADVVQGIANVRPEVSCPGDLQGKVGVTMNCTYTIAGATQQLNIKVTNVSGNTVNFEVANPQAGSQ